MIELALGGIVGLSLFVALSLYASVRRSRMLWIAHVRAENLRRVTMAVDEFGDEYADVTLDDEGIVRAVSTISGEMLFGPFGTSKVIVNRTEIGANGVRA